jgi:hypothetical protein
MCVFLEIQEVTRQKGFELRPSSSEPDALFEIDALAEREESAMHIEDIASIRR